MHSAWSIRDYYYYCYYSYYSSTTATTATTTRRSPFHVMDVEALGRAVSGGGSVKKEPEDENDIKDFAETTMNELLGWYGYDKVDSRDTQGLNLNRFTTKDGGGTSHRNAMDHMSINGGTESSSGLDSPTGGSSGGGNRNEPASCQSPTPSQSQASPNNLPNGYVVCAWCQKVGMKLFTLRTTNGIKAFCSELCFTQCRRASFKKYKVCDWCKHIRHTVNYVDFQDGEQQLQFCSDKCLNQYKMNIFCRETQAHLQMHPHLRDASKLLSGACAASSASGARGMTLITPDLWLRDCGKRGALSGHSDEPNSGAESEGSGTSSTAAEVRISKHCRLDPKPGKIFGGTTTENFEGKENSTRPMGEGELSHRHARLRERVERRRHRHQSKKGNNQAHSPLLHHYHHRHSHIRQVLDKLDKRDKAEKSDKHDKRKNKVYHRLSHSRSTVASDKSTPRLLNGSAAAITTSTTTTTISGGGSTTGLTGGSPVSLSSLNIPMRPNGLQGLPPPRPPSSPTALTDDLLRAAMPPQPHPHPHHPSGLLRLPPPFPHGLRSPVPYCLPPGAQLPPSLQPFLANLSHFGPGPPPSGGPTNPMMPNNGSFSSLLPPITVMVPYPVLVPIPIPIPIPLPFPMKDFVAAKTKSAEECKSDTKVLEAGHAAQNPTEHPHTGQRSSHQNSSKRVDSVITRLVNSKMSHIFSPSSATIGVNEPSAGSSTSLLRLKEEPREVSPSPSAESDDRPSCVSDTVHSLAGSTYSNYAANPFAESAEDSLGCPDSGAGDSDDSNSRTAKEFETAICDGLSIPSSPTSRLRHRLVSTVVDHEPHMKRKCLRARLLAK